MSLTLALTANAYNLNPSGDTTGAVDTAAFQAAYAAAAAGFRTVTGISDKCGTVVITLKPGTYFINITQGMMSSASPSVKIRGLVWQGSGSDVTVISYVPAVSGPLLVNQRWLNLQFRGITFVCNDAASDFLDSQEQAGASNIQYYNFYDCLWAGSWQRLWSLTGQNNNSEWTFDRCMVGTTTLTDGLYIPVTGGGGSDQFLNFWFSNFKFWSTTGTWINVARGGHIKIYKSDVSGWNGSTTTDTYLFNLLGNNHAEGVCSFLCDGLRIEQHNDHGLLLNTQWPQGNITFRQLDQSFGNNIRTASVQHAKVDMTGNIPGATIRFEQCDLIGVHAYVGGNGYIWQQRFLYDQCTLLQQSTATAFISVSGVSNAGNNPPIRFRNCRSRDNATNTGYREVIDSDLFWNRIPGGSTSTRTIFFGDGAADLPVSNGSLIFQLPINSVITRVRFYTTNTGLTGAYNYTLQDGNAAIIAGGTGVWSGSNAGTPLLTSDISLFYPLTSDTQAKIAIVDTLASPGRVGIFNLYYFLVDYIG